ncbi:MAG TPA: carbohydrate-binding family 9-like protein, partial [Armatimonadota bacterium]|nr:carbohydrate-binding family 9-like protein [Armatimonadota bacterium]
LHLTVHDGHLLAQAATAATSIKDEARRLASAMHDLPQAAPEPPMATTPAPPTVPRPARPPAPAFAYLGAFHGITPQVPESAYLAPGSSVIGDVRLGEDVSLWPGAVVRGDVAPVRVGARVNVQEGAILHVSPQLACVVGSGVTIGHGATVHACTIGDDTLIGIHAVVLDGARIGKHCIIAAGSVVPPGMEVPPGKMVMGVPAKVVRDLTPQEIERVHWNADSYVSLKNEYRSPSPVAEAVTPGGAAGLRPTPPARGVLPRYECRRAAGEITIDGSLDDPGWAHIAPMSRLLHSHNGDEPAQPTEVKACWDDTFLYLSYSCKETDIWGNFESRDDPLYDEEVVEAFLCPTGDLRHYFEFEVSPLNILFDARVFSPEGDRRMMLVDRQWDAPGIRTAVRVSGILNDRHSPDIGWIAEVALPFSDLGLQGPPAPGTVWRANFYRIERGPITEFTAWSPTYADPADFHVPACFGELVFVA